MYKSWVDMKRNWYTLALAGLALAAVFFSAGYFTGRGVGGDVKVTVEKTEQDRTLQETDDDGLVNINTATRWELMSLPKIGEVIADRIIDYRLQNGAFLYKEEIMNVQGVGEAVYDVIADLITV